MSELLLDRAGRRRSPATMPGFHAGRPPRNKGVRYPADPPRVEEIIAVIERRRRQSALRFAPTLAGHTGIALLNANGQMCARTAPQRLFS